MNRCCYTAMKVGIVLLVALMSGAAVPSAGRCDVRNSHVTVSNGLVSIDSSGQKLGTLLGEIAEDLSVKIYLFDNTADETVSISVQDEMPVDAILRVLNNRNYCVVLGQDKSEVGVELINGLEQGSILDAGIRKSGRLKSSKTERAVKKSTRSSRTTASRDKDGAGSRNRQETGSDKASVDGEEETIYSWSGDSQEAEDTGEEADSDDGDDATEDASNSSETAEAGSDDDYAYEDTESDAVSSNSEYVPTEIERLENKIRRIQEQIDSGYADEWYDHWVEIRGEQWVTHPDVDLERYENRLEELKAEAQ